MLYCNPAVWPCCRSVCVFGCVWVLSCCVFAYYNFVTCCISLCVCVCVCVCACMCVWAPQSTPVTLHRNWSWIWHVLQPLLCFISPPCVFVCVLLLSVLTNEYLPARLPLSLCVSFSASVCVCDIVAPSVTLNACYATRNFSQILWTM